MSEILVQAYYYVLKTIRNREFVFYSVLFPMILATLYFAGMSSLMEDDMSAIPVGVTEGFSLVDYKEILGNIEILEVEPYTLEEAEIALDNDEIVAFVELDGNMLVKESGLNQSIVRSILDEIRQVIALGQTEAIEHTQETYIKMENTPSSPVVIAFFGLIAMVTLYGMFNGVNITTTIQAPLSDFAARLNLTPMKRWQYIVMNFIISLLTNMVGNVLCVLYIQYILSIKVVEYFWPTFLLILVANIFGVTFGILCGLPAKLSEDTKSNIALYSVLILTFIAGGMVPGMQVVFRDVLPEWLFNLNPVHIISENLYRVNLLNDLSLYWSGLAVLICLSIVFLVVAAYNMRGKRYDSL